MARVFFALPLGDKLKDRLGQEADRLRLSEAAVAWVRPENYHATLHFFGELEDEALLELDQPLMELARSRPPLALVAKGLGSFPEGEIPPRVLWCGLVDDEGHEGALESLWRELQGILREMGFRPEKPPFKPHITIGRVKGSTGGADLAERLGPARRREFAHFKVREMVLYETGRTREGIFYGPLREFRFAGR